MILVSGSVGICEEGGLYTATIVAKTKHVDLDDLLTELEVVFGKLSPEQISGFKTDIAAGKVSGLTLVPPVQ